MYNRKTKIVATIGPAIGSPDNLIKALEAGVDVCRVNCSHCKSGDDIRRNIANVRRAGAALGRSVNTIGSARTKDKNGEIEPIYP